MWHKALWVSSVGAQSSQTVPGFQGMIYCFKVTGRHTPFSGIIREHADEKQRSETGHMTNASVRELTSFHI